MDEQKPKIDIKPFSEKDSSYYTVGKSYDVGPSEKLYTISPNNVFPNYTWEWTVFGGAELVVKLMTKPPLWRRVLTRIFLGSKWKKL
jgi:hypothetical protein